MFSDLDTHCVGKPTIEKRRKMPGITAAFSTTALSRLTVLAATTMVLLLVASGPAWANFDDAVAAYNKGEYAIALEEFRLLAEKGDPRAQYLRSFMENTGQGIYQANRSAVLNACKLIRETEWVIRCVPPGRGGANKSTASPLTDGGPPTPTTDGGAAAASGDQAGIMEADDTDPAGAEPVAAGITATPDDATAETGRDVGPPGGGEAGRRPDGNATRTATAPAETPADGLAGIMAIFRTAAIAAERAGIGAAGDAASVAAEDTVPAPRGGESGTAVSAEAGRQPATDTGHTAAGDAKPAADGEDGIMAFLRAAAAVAESAWLAASTDAEIATAGTVETPPEAGGAVAAGGTGTAAKDGGAAAGWTEASPKAAGSVAAGGTGTAAKDGGTAAGRTEAPPKAGATAAPGKVTIVADGEVKVVTGDNVKIIAGDNVEIIAGDNVRIVTGDNAKIVAGDNVKIVAGGKVGIVATGDVGVVAGGDTRIVVADNVARPAEDNLEFVRAGLRAGKIGARHLFRGKRLSEITLPSIMTAALERNLDVLVAQQRYLAVVATRIESRAIYDPLLSLSWAYTKTKTLQRDEYILRYRSKKDDEDEAEIVGCITVDGQVVNPESNKNCFTNPVRTLEREFATSPTKPSAIPNSWTATAGVTQLLDWGGQLTFNVSSTHRKKNTYAVDLLDAIISDRDPFEFGSRMPWTTAATISFATPLPGTKNFGDHGSQRNLDVFLADSGSRRTSAERAKARNSVLEAVSRSFWDLVESLEELKTNAAHRQVLEELLTRTQRLFEARRVTAYEIDQVEADLGNIRNQEEISWGSYLARSNAVLRLLDQDLDRVLVPAGVRGFLRQDAGISFSDAERIALENSPDIKISLEALTSSRETVRFRHNQTMPDLSLTVSFSSTQTDTTFGYRTWEDSLNHIFTPDKSEFVTGLRLTLPFGTRAEQAALAGSRRGEKQASDNVRDTRNRVVQRVGTAVNNFLSTKELIRQTQTDLNLALLAYNKVRELHDLGLVTKFELLRKLEDLRLARLANNRARIELQRVRAELYSAQGVLDRHYENP